MGDLAHLHYTTLADNSETVAVSHELARVLKWAENLCYQDYGTSQHVGNTILLKNHWKQEQGKGMGR